MERGPLLRLIGVWSLAAATYAFVIRPWMLAWGSTAEERRRPLPGDDVEPDAKYVTTRAATIRAPAQAIGPWLVQMGQDRAGFSAWIGDRLYGDRFRDSQVDGLGPSAEGNRRAGQHLDLAPDPLPDGGTRLVTRMKQDYRWETPRLAIFNFLLMELGDFAMERRMLKGIKRRAESAERSR